MIEPVEKEINGKTFILYKIPAVIAREILLQLPSVLPKIGDYALNEKIMFKLLSFAAVKREGGEPLKLVTRELIDNHCDIKTLLVLEKEMLAYNFDFFPRGQILTFFEDFAQKLPTLASKMLTDSLGQLLQKEKPLSTN